MYVGVGVGLGVCVYSGNDSFYLSLCKYVIFDRASTCYFLQLCSTSLP